MRKLGAPRALGAIPARVIDWLPLRVIRLPPETCLVSLLSVVRSATVLCDSLIVSRLASNPAIVSLPKLRLVKSNKVGVLGCAVSGVLPAGAGRGGEPPAAPGVVSAVGQIV